jgi:hypothetical protein
MGHAFCMMFNLSAQLWLVGAVMCGGSSGVVGLIALGQPEALSLTSVQQQRPLSKLGIAIVLIDDAKYDGCC